jgi:hypothetical protein
MTSSAFLQAASRMKLVRSLPEMATAISIKSRFRISTHTLMGTVFSVAAVFKGKRVVAMILILSLFSF